MLFEVDDGSAQAGQGYQEVIDGHRGQLTFASKDETDDDGLCVLGCAVGVMKMIGCCLFGVQPIHFTRQSKMCEGYLQTYQIHEVWKNVVG